VSGRFEISEVCRARSRLFFFVSYCTVTLDALQAQPLYEWLTPSVRRAVLAQTSPFLPAKPQLLSTSRLYARKPDYLLTHGFPISYSIEGRCDVGGHVANVDRFLVGGTYRGKLAVLETYCRG